MKHIAAFLLACVIGIPIGLLAQKPVFEPRVQSGTLEGVTTIEDPPIKTEPDPAKPVSVTEEQKLRAQILVLQQQIAELRKQALSFQANWASCQDRIDTVSRDAAWTQLSKDAGCTVNRVTFACESPKP